MRIGREAAGVGPAVAGLLAEAPQLLLADPPLEERPRVDAGRRVALDVDQVAAVVLVRRAPEVVEADLVERGGGLERRDVAAELRRLLVGLQHRRQRVPADQRADAPLDRLVGRQLGAVLDADRVDVRRGRVQRRGDAARSGPRHQTLEQRCGAVAAVVVEDRFEGLDPLLGLDGIYIMVGHGARDGEGLRSDADTGACRDACILVYKLPSRGNHRGGRQISPERPGSPTTAA